MSGGKVIDGSICQIIAGCAVSGEDTNEQSVSVLTGIAIKAPGGAGVRPSHLTLAAEMIRF